MPSQVWHLKQWKNDYQLSTFHSYLFIIVSAIKKVSLIANKSRASVHNKWVNFWIVTPSFRKTTKESPL